MNITRNPFNATLGVTPPLLVGRDEVINDFGHALDDGPGGHERVSLIVGPRGIGKTVLLNACEQQARMRGWQVFSETAAPGFVDRLRTEIIMQLSPQQPTLSSINLTLFSMGFGASWDKDSVPPESYSLRHALKDLLAAQRELDRIAGQEPTGVIITLDEMHHQRSEEVIDFGATIQHLIREEENIAVVMAGIPSSIKPLLSSKHSANPVTFLRRANRVELDVVSDADVSTALESPLKDLGIEWSQEALSAAVAACQGYPFMIQLVGLWTLRNHLSQHTNGHQAHTISLDTAQEGISKARRKLGHLVHEPALAELSDTDRSFLLFMSQDDGPSAMNDIANRLGKSAQYASNYRRRLLDAELIISTTQGFVDFSLPYLRDYLREHAASLVSYPQGMK